MKVSKLDEMLKTKNKYGNSKNPLDACCFDVIALRGQIDGLCKQLKSKDKQIDELENLKEKLEQYEKGFKGTCTTCENVGETNLKLKQENKQLKAFLREACKVMLMPHYTKKEFIKSDKIQEILKGGNDE